MSKVSYVNIPSGLEQTYKKGLQPGDRFTFSRIRVKDLFLSRSRVKGITERSLLKELAPIWLAFSDSEKNAWSTAGSYCGLTGYKCFVHDTSARRKAGLTGFSSPNIFYQANCGRILIESPSTGLQIEQAHPLNYYISKKVAGTRSQYSPLLITEPFTLPLQIKISYKTVLTALTGEAKARFYAIIYSSYQGMTLETPVSIDFGMNDDWQIKTASISHVKGLVRGYSVFIEVEQARGNLYFDNVELYHGSENWARDPFCNNITQNFTHAFFQVAKHWVATNPNDGADFGSFYFEP